MLNKELIQSNHYCGENAQKIEFEKIFSNSWIFAAMESDFPENNSYVTLEIFNYPIVIQNFKNDLRAFQNICPHRFNKIQTEARGTGIFMCDYHNWSFDKEGKPKTIPHKTSFDTESEKFKCLKVKSLRLEKVGKFIFVSLNDEVEPIEKYLGSFYDKLIEVSNALDFNFYFSDDLQDINWKIIVENVVEAYHCPAIHQNTLYGMGFCRIAEINNEYENGHSVADYPKEENVVPDNKILKYLENIEFKHDTFRHYFIFPNLLISSTQGTSIYVGNILPATSEKSTLRKRFYSPKFVDNFEPRKAVHNSFLEMAKTSINQILDEDKKVLEQIQKNIPFINDTYIIGNQEIRIAHFHKKYLETIK